MKYLKNKTVIGILAIVFGLLISFIISPLYNRALEAKSKIVRVDKFIEKGSLITKEDIKVVEVGSYNLPGGVITSEQEVVGKYAVADLYQDENILKEKISESPLSNAQYLEGMDGTYGAISITLQSFAAGLSGKLLPGDIVRVITTDTNSKATKMLPELQYVKVLASTTQKGVDIEEKHKNSDVDEENIPVTVTLQVNQNQALSLASIEQLEQCHLELVYRGTEEDSKRFLEQQLEIIKEMEVTDALVEDEITVDKEKIIKDKEIEQDENTKDSIDNNLPSDTKKEVETNKAKEEDTTKAANTSKAGGEDE